MSKCFTRLGSNKYLLTYERDIGITVGQSVKKDKPEVTSSDNGSEDRFLKYRDQGKETGNKRERNILIRGNTVNRAQKQDNLDSF